MGCVRLRWSATSILLILMEQLVISQPPLHDRLPSGVCSILVLILGYIFVTTCAPTQHDVLSYLLYAFFLVVLVSIALQFGGNVLLWQHFELADGFMPRRKLFAGFSVRQTIYTVPDVSRVMIAIDGPKPFHHYNPYSVLVTLNSGVDLFVQGGLSEQAAKSLALAIALRLHTNVDSKVEKLQRQRSIWS